MWATVIAILIPSMLFGWLHSSNADATTLSVLNTMVFGTLFGAAYVLTGELAVVTTSVVDGVANWFKEETSGRRCGC
jgi:membrane protease YdiL (CAAX protease family)